MTIDDILDAYHRAYKAHMNSNGGALIWDAERAGVTAIVRALRDEIYLEFDDDETVKEAIEYIDNKILGSDAGEKVADIGGAFEGLMDGLAKACVPDAAPAVCEWTQGKYGWLVTACRAQYGLSPFYYKPKGCCEFCGKPIKFTEAK